MLEKIVLENPKLASPDNISSKRGRYYYNFICSLYYFLILDHKQAYLHSKELLSPELQQIAPNEYIEGILQHLTSCMGLSYFDETLKGLQLADTFIAQESFRHSTHFLLRVFYFRICYKLIAYCHMGSLDNLLLTIEEATTQVALYYKQLSIEMKLVIFGNLRNAYIACGNHEKAEELLNILLYKESKFVRKDVYNDLFLSRVFSHLSVENYDLLPAMAAAANRQYRQTKDTETQFEIGLKITSILMKDINYCDQAKRKSVLIQIKSILEQYITSLKGLNKFHEIYSFYFIWTESLLQRQPFYTIAATMYKQRTYDAADGTMAVLSGRNIGN